MGESGLIGEHFAGEATPLRVAKVLRRPDDADFSEVLSVSTVKFDPRPGWVLLAKPIGARPRRQELVWMHPEDSRFVWVRTFYFQANFSETPQVGG